MIDAYRHAATDDHHQLRGQLAGIVDHSPTSNSGKSRSLDAQAWIAPRIGCRSVSLPDLTSL